MRQHRPDFASTTTNGVRETDRALAGCLLGFTAVRAVLLGGSRATRSADGASDTDLYTLYRGGLPDAAVRASALGTVADARSVHEETAWGVEDHLLVGGHQVEIVYLDADALGLDAFYDPGVAPSGFTTAFLPTLAQGLVIADPHEELAAIRRRLETYPEATRTRILAQAPRELAEYLTTLQKAQVRHDWVGVTNRRAAFQAAWFDLFFAVNRVYHPGEKRLVAHASGCRVQIAELGERWRNASLARADAPDLHRLLTGLADDLVGLASGSRSVEAGTLDG